MDMENNNNNNNNNDNDNMEQTDNDNETLITTTTTERQENRRGARGPSSWNVAIRMLMTPDENGHIQNRTLKEASTSLRQMWPGLTNESKKELREKAQEERAALVEHNGTSMHKCTICHKEFSTQRSLVLHKQSVHGNEQFICPVCLKEFSTVGSTQRHIRQVHESQKRVEKAAECPHCHKTFLNKSNCKKHVKQHHQ